MSTLDLVLSHIPRLVYYEGGPVCTHARSLWRLEPLRIRCGGEGWGQVGDYSAAWERRKGLEGDMEKILEGLGCSLGGLREM